MSGFAWWEENPQQKTHPQTPSKQKKTPNKPTPSVYCEEGDV